MTSGMILGLLGEMCQPVRQIASCDGSLLKGTNGNLLRKT
jgi:hypothetical protein